MKLNQNTMKPLLAILSSFVAMAAADQEQIITALIFICVSVYLFTKSLPKWALRNSTPKSSKNYQSKPNKMTPSQPTSTGHSSSDSELTGSSTAQTPTNSAESISNVSESNPASTQNESGVNPFFDRYEEWRKEHQRKTDIPNMYFSSDASSIMYTIIKEAYMTGYYQGVEMAKSVYNGRKN